MTVRVLMQSVHCLVRPRARQHKERTADGSTKNCLCLIKDHVWRDLFVLWDRKIQGRRWWFCGNDEPTVLREATGGACDAVRLRDPFCRDALGSVNSDRLVYASWTCLDRFTAHRTDVRSGDTRTSADSCS